MVRVMVRVMVTEEREEIRAGEARRAGALQELEVRWLGNRIIVIEQPLEPLTRRRFVRTRVEPCALEAVPARVDRQEHGAFLNQVVGEVYAAGEESGCRGVLLHRHFNVGVHRRGTRRRANGLCADRAPGGRSTGHEPERILRR